MDNKDKIKLDFDFLEKDAPEAGSHKRVPVKNSESATRGVSKPFKLSDGAKKWLTGFAVVGVLIFIGALSDDSSTSTSNTSGTSVTASQNDDDLIQTGEYMCSRYHHGKAGELEPSNSEEAALDSKTNQLQAESDSLDSERYEIENMYVDQYSQWSIDQYNNRIDNFNTDLESYQFRAQMHDRSIDNYNARVQTYNNYLIANCTPSR
jgi:hypothetical protein